MLRPTQVLIMLLTDREREFLAAFIYEARPIPSKGRPRRNSIVGTLLYRPLP